MLEGDKRLSPCPQGIQPQSQAIPFSKQTLCGREWDLLFARVMVLSISWKGSLVAEFLHLKNSYSGKWSTPVIEEDMCRECKD